MGKIHSTAVVSVEAKIGNDVEIGPFAVIEGDVEVGDGSRLEAHSILRDGSRIGKSVTVGNFAVVGGLPQDLKFDATIRTFATVGNGTTLREGVTINRSTKVDCSTVVGANCFLMATAHVGHDCSVGNSVVIANASLLAGHVAVGDFSFLGGGCGIHQFCRIGEGVMLGGNSSTTMDVAPFTICAERDALFGVNVIGLRRRGVPAATIDAIRQCYRRVFLGTGNTRQSAAELLEDEIGTSDEARRFLAFFSEGKRGFAKPGRTS